MTALIEPLDEHNRKLLGNVRLQPYENPVPHGRYNLVVIGGDEIDNHLMAGQRTPALVERDLAEHPMLDLVPFAGAGRKVKDMELQASVVWRGPRGSKAAGPCCASSTRSRLHA
jgi:hypothetical protein